MIYSTKIRFLCRAPIFCQLLSAGKKGIIFGALNEQSIAWRVAERAVEEGAEIILTNTAVAVRMGQLNELGQKLNAKVVPADATKEEELEVVFQEL